MAWITGDASKLVAKLDEAFDRRETHKDKIRNSRLQMQQNTCD